VSTYGTPWEKFLRVSNSLQRQQSSRTPKAVGGRFADRNERPVGRLVEWRPESDGDLPPPPPAQRQAGGAGGSQLRTRWIQCTRCACKSRRAAARARAAARYATATLRPTCASRQHTRAWPWPWTTRAGTKALTIALRGLYTAPASLVAYTYSTDDAKPQLNVLTNWKSQ
jgi:hypothetical protein